MTHAPTILPAILPTILMVGASGFVARRIATRLEKEFPLIHVLTRCHAASSSGTSASSSASTSSFSFSGTYTVYDPRNIEHALHKIDPDIILYTPGVITPGTSPTDLASARYANILNPIKCMQYLATRQKDSCLVFFNSYAIYNPTYPRTFYMGSKKTAQRELQSIAQAHPHILFYDLIIHDLYAEDDSRDKILHRLVQALMGRTAWTVHHPQNRLSFVHMDDFADTLAAICHAPSPNHYQGPAAIRGDKDISIAELAERISSIGAWAKPTLTMAKDAKTTCLPAPIDPLPIHHNTIPFSDVLERFVHNHA